MNESRPTLAITMGDPAGIGPEVAAKALARPEVNRACRAVVVGDAGVMRRAVAVVGAPLRVRPVRRIDDAAGECGTIDVYDLANVDAGACRPGELSAAAGAAAFDAIRAAIELAAARSVDAVVTGPINKAALHLAGHRFDGQTEIFAHFTNTTDYAMLLAEGPLRIAHVPTHVSLRRACDAVTAARVATVIRLAHAAAVRLGGARPRVGVAALNPHAGEGGLFGSEEDEQILPAIEACLREGIDVVGPIPADTFFPRAVAGAYDVCVAMYHDQGHIPLKLLGFRYDAAGQRWQSVNGINVTLGLPILRVSVDHGTAFDQAGKGTASETSLLNAIDYAVRMSARPANGGAT